MNNWRVQSEGFSQKRTHLCHCHQIRKESTTVTQVPPCPSHSLTNGVLILTLERSFCIFKQLGSYPSFIVCRSFYLFLFSGCIGCFALRVHVCPLWEWGTRGAQVDMATALLRVQQLPLLPPPAITGLPVFWRFWLVDAQWALMWSKVAFPCDWWCGHFFMFIGCLCSLFCEVAVQFPRLYFSGIACLSYWFVELLYVFWTWALGAVCIANLFSSLWLALLLNGIYWWAFLIIIKATLFIFPVYSVLLVLFLKTLYSRWGHGDTLIFSFKGFTVFLSHLDL